jgi:NADPH-dependent glutamate synthase beta subunit-like oxidoreductase
MKTSNTFVGKPNGTYHSVNELFQKNPSLLLKRVKGDSYTVIHTFDTPNDCLLRLRHLRATSGTPNDYQIHTNLQS